MRTLTNTSWRTFVRRTVQRKTSRRGIVLVLAASMLIMVFGFVAFTVDTGFIALAKGQMQNASDSASLGAGTELLAGLGHGGVAANVVSGTATDRAKSLTAAHRVGDVMSAYLDGGRDIRFGHYQWDSIAGEWVKNWGATPYNLVEVTVHRDQGLSGLNNDRSLPLFFAPLIGHDSANLNVTSTVAIKPGVGFQIAQGSTATVGALPIAVDLPTWNNLMAGAITADQYKYNASTGTVSPGADGVFEINIYPEGTTNLPPGNRGTVDLGSPNNSTADLVRQIRYGLNADDLSYFGGSLRTDYGPLYINGDTGISAGIKDDLAAIIGQPRAIPIFTTVSGPGNNATYTVVKFVGVRILYVKLTGSPSQKKVIVQPAAFSSPYVITGNVEMTSDSFYGKPHLVD